MRAVTADDQPQWLTAEQLATALGVDDSTIRRWANDGEIPGAWHTPGGHWRFPSDAIEQMRTRSEVSNGR